MSAVPLDPPSAGRLEPAGLDRDHALGLYHQMLRIRRFEERCAELYSASKIRGFLHLYVGEEAIAAGTMPALRPDDAVVATYREHGHALARGLPMDRVMAEMYGSVEGVSRGRGGSMHLFDAATRFYGGNAIVAGGLPIAVGLALADKHRGRDTVTACFFGEGAVDEGEFHESLNLAALWDLPVLFCCENNRYAMGMALDRAESQTDLAAKAASYALPAWAVDGMDVLAVERAVRHAVSAIRGGGGPHFLELETYRFRAHSMYDPDLYRSKDEIERWRERDPLVLLEGVLRDAGLVDDADLERLEGEVAEELRAAVEFAEAAPMEPVEELSRFVVSPPVARAVPAGTPAATHPGEPVTVTFREAARQALREALERDDRVLLLGEDVGAYGGCFAVTMGLLDEFGPERVRDTPLSESGFTGAGIGAAMGGLRPIVEIMTCNFSLLALDQIVNNAATLLHMSGGQFNVPLVIRTTAGAGRQLAAQHSHSFEPIFAHVPGLRIVAVASIGDARGLLGPALEDPDPVVIFEYPSLYNLEAELPATPAPVDLSRAAVRRSGRDLTLVTYGATLLKALEAADRLAADGIDVEVVDLRVLRPLDQETVLASVARTHRLLVVEEAWRTGGVGAEVAARVAEEAFWDLDAPVARVGGVEVPTPYARHLEEAAIPQVDTIVAAARRAVGHDG